MSDHSLEVQRQRLLAALRQNPITTLEARQDLDIMHPGGRVLELRLQGHPIITTWVRQQGHRIGRYSLMLARQAAQGGGQ